MAAYVEKILVFVDILGWSDLLQSSDNYEILLNSIDSVAETVAEISLLAPSIKETTNDIWEEVESEIPLLAPIGECDIQSTHFSDTIVLTASPHKIATSPMIATVIGLTSVLWRAGYYVRGAITRGQIHHTDRSLYGPALVRAYKIEQKVAIYPRIVITDDAVDAIAIKDFVRRDPCDGLSHLNILALSKEEDRARLRKILESRIEKDSGDLVKLQKHNWSRRYLDDFEAGTSDGT